MIFLSFSCLLKKGKGTTPLSSINRFHFQFSFVYVSFTILLIFLNKLDFSIQTFLEFAIGLFVYIFIHYAVFLNFFSLAQRSISSNILIMLLDPPNQKKISNILTDYANGKGFSYIKKSRLEDMENLGWITMEKNSYSITPKGSKTIWVVKTILNFWGLKQLGK